MAYTGFRLLRLCAAAQVRSRTRDSGASAPTGSGALITLYTKLRYWRGWRSQCRGHGVHEIPVPSAPEPKKGRKKTGLCPVSLIHVPSAAWRHVVCLAALQGLTSEGRALDFAKGFDSSDIEKAMVLGRSLQTLKFGSRRSFYSGAVDFSGHFRIPPR